jgi:hypothetical protein
MTLNGEILDTVYCENNDKLKGTLLDMRFCVLNNASVITHEVRDEGQHIVRREKTGNVTMTCVTCLILVSSFYPNAVMFVYK